MRIPGEGTEKLINRQQEAEVIHAVSGRGLCDEPVYINPENGYKITKYLEGVRCCDPENIDDLHRCMEKLKSFHNMKITVSHTFDIFGQIDSYETLWEGDPSVYRDYSQTKEKVFSLRNYIDSLNTERCLTHIDAVPDNFLFYTMPDGTEGLQLTDWEYAGMQDPHVDIAMFCIYALYDRCQADRLIDIYFKGACPERTRLKIYAYIAACGLLWSNWCEYKRSLGVEFGEYALRQYRFAKEYCRIVREALDA
jgi:thiamine kinase-like enzyme